MSDHLDTRAARLAAALDDFLSSSPDVEAAAVVSFDGLPMASALPDDLEEDRVGAMSAALLSLGEQAALGLGRGQLNQVFVEGEHGFVFLMSCRDQAVLAAVTGRAAKIGFMLFEMRQAAERIGTLLAPASDDAFEAETPARFEPWARPEDREEEPSPVEQVVAAFASVPDTAPDGAAAVQADPFASAPFDADPFERDESPFAALGELRAVSSPPPVAPPPVAPPPAAPAFDAEPASRSDDRSDDHDADLLSVLATEPLRSSDDHDLLTEALFEVRRATGGDSAQNQAWGRQESPSANGWG